ncbi:DNA-binding domain-containing protein [Shewanella sp. CG12_big_fil_rev_8_21_14_0_65_47_15]|uniref:HvfC/BufC N-terminal domain-containing protein n=1 Tax=Shewanella sp. CG12_big_fil_rev_8_21_14_0_65_47_15 TaxID=1975537 RepID=UPI000CC10B3E|nr:DNA-binding domain-containing protein [Shewanella sp. CG12_big_fil_rev_8_21_14_0_65_47_15]PIW60665.1 MAG: DUF2063 domain-containing protein [Shewanella sp. CG12_big_fil_rev_8_21_14_0_65_47_15]
MSNQAEWMDALLTPTSASPSGLTTWNGSDPTKRFDVYRNNVTVSLIDALADSYPVVQALVGEAFFRAMAAEFIRHYPPKSPVLAWYGAQYSDFIASFPPVAGLPYLADVARLEWLRVESWHAADAEPLSQEALRSLLSDEAMLARICFTLHPALRVLNSTHPVVSIWSVHQSQDPVEGMRRVDLTCSQTALLVRPELGVEIIHIEPNAVRFIDSLGSGASFVAAVADSGPFDFPETLSLLIRSHALVAASPMENTL